MFEKQKGGGGDTAHSNLEHLVRCSNKDEDTAQNFKIFPKQGGTPHIPIQVIWSDVQTRVGTPHKALEQLGWGHRTKYLFKKIHMGHRDQDGEKVDKMSLIFLK